MHTYMYIAASAKENSPILGLTHIDKALIFQWVLFAESEIAANYREWVVPLRGIRPAVKPAIDAAAERVKRALGALNTVLETKTYLVGESVTYADICVAISLVNLYTFVLDKPTRDQFKNVTRYYTTLINKELFKKYLGERPLCETPLKYTPPKKEKKPAASNAPPPAPKKTKEATPAKKDQEEAAKPATKPKSALDLLPPSPLKLDEWKRMYR